MEIFIGFAAVGSAAGSNDSKGCDNNSILEKLLVTKVAACVAKYVPSPAYKQTWVGPFSGLTSRLLLDVLDRARSIRVEPLDIPVRGVIDETRNVGT